MPASTNIHESSVEQHPTRPRRAPALREVSVSYLYDLLSPMKSFPSGVTLLPHLLVPVLDILQSYVWPIRLELPLSYRRGKTCLLQACLLERLQVAFSVVHGICLGGSRHFRSQSFCLSFHYSIVCGVYNDTIVLLGSFDRDELLVDFSRNLFCWPLECIAEPTND